MASSAGGDDSGNTGNQALELGTVLLQNFIYERVQRHSDSHTADHTALTREQLGGGELVDPNHRRLGQYLQQIGDELDGNVQLQMLIDNPALRPTSAAFIEIASQIFSDGKFNWGRVVALFYLACRLVIKALMTKLPDIIRTIIKWTTDYLREHVIHWIQEQGGWDGIRAHFGTPTWQTVAVFAVGALTAALVIRNLS